MHRLIDSEEFHREGWARVRHPLFPAARCDEALALARAFFDLPECEKRQLAIEQSPHFRGYSVMQNPRDWREQIHFGREEPAQNGPVWQQLRGPNLWPADPHWRHAVLQLMADLETAGREILAALAPFLFLRDDELPYTLLKMIHYQEFPSSQPRSGVAPHVDFSWITLLIQDDAGGLEIRGPDGAWQPAPAVPGTLVINAGEILQYATGGYFRATPHRVVNGVRSRISLPFFLNPGLETAISQVHAQSPDEFPDSEHVHRVFPQTRISPFVFGDEEWQRKGLGVYCGACFDKRISSSISE